MPKRTENVEEKIAANKEKVLEALKQMPVIEVACKRSGISRATYYRWCKEDISFKTATCISLSEGKGLINDAVESQLISSALSGKFASMKFWLTHNHQNYKTVAQAEYEGKKQKEKNSPSGIYSESFFGFDR